MVLDPFRPPTDAEIAEAERKLQFVFPPEYVVFLKSGGNVENAVFEPAVVLPGSGHLDLFEIAESAWAREEIPRDCLPFIEDNSDYFLLSQMERCGFGRTTELQTKGGQLSQLGFTRFAWSVGERHT